ncbi:fumarylacetoacetate hydrolase family protein [Thermodesulfatator atlanticus]|uniref:fumarylacetoacetate hydrolase family protein n=1 Tax=Thermodesulfatator atlanticus TaxID=501497 RepID=UPI0003B396B1|nr:fumarylacetoacetate hydrolase family protein [Thermodesulfatator atlanticus]
MRLGRVTYKGKTYFAAFQEQNAILLEKPFFEGIFLSSQKLPIEEVKILSPTLPSKIIALGLNYRDHAKELGLPLPKEPLIFLKPPSAVIGQDETIIIPPESKRVDYEAELAVVIGKRARRVKPEEASSFILGYTCFNDVTARDLQQKDAQWTRAKSFDTFAPMGPWIETDLDPTDLKVRSYLNGKLRQDSSTRELVFSIPEIISFVSNIMTLLPGDVIATGTPPGIGPLSPGDVIEVEISGIGRLKNTVSQEKL